MAYPGDIRRCAIVAFEGIAHAAHPLLTEDTGTQGSGNVEVENGLSWNRTGAATAFMYRPQLSLGLSPTFDLIVQPSWLSSRSEGSVAAQGWGDTNLDAKGRFFGDVPMSLAIRAGVTLATNQRGLGWRTESSPRTRWASSCSPPRRSPSMPISA